jgi:hypothetical protein
MILVEARKCRYCGEAIEPISDVAAEHATYCGECGKQTSGDWSTCPFCGAAAPQLVLEPIPPVLEATTTTQLFKPVVAKPMGVGTIAGIAALSIVGFFVIAWILGAVVGGGPATSGTRRITYRVTGHDYRYPSSPMARISYTNITGGTDGVTSGLPWEETIDLRPSDFAFLSAQQQGNGDLTAEILYNGSVVKTSTSSGEFCIAEVSGRVD